MTTTTMMTTVTMITTVTMMMTMTTTCLVRCAIPHAAMKQLAYEDYAHGTCMQSLRAIKSNAAACN